MIKHFFLTIVASLFLSSVLFGDIEKVWERSLSEVFPDPKQPHSHEPLSPSFYPALVNNHLILGSQDGRVKGINIYDQSIKNIIFLPLTISEVTSYPKNHCVFKGRHKLTNKLYYCSVNVHHNRMRGVLHHDGPMIPFKDWGVFEKSYTLYVFNPDKGKTIYRQESPRDIVKPVFTPEKKTLFLTSKGEITQLILPKFGGSYLTMSNRKKKREILKFKSIATLDPDMVADTLYKNTLYYHRKNGEIGVMNIQSKKILWERTYFKKGMTIKGPFIYKGLLYYLVSYPKSNKKKIGSGKLIALDPKNGISKWVSKDLPFQNFGIVQFGQAIVSTDDTGNLLFLDLKTGEIRAQHHVGNGVTKPTVNGNLMFEIGRAHV